MTRLDRLWAAYLVFATWAGDLALAFLRVLVGIQFFLAGKGKLGAIEDVAGYFATLGIPWPTANAVAASSVEFVGGLLLIVGLGSRFIALPLAVTMLVATFTAHKDVFSDGVMRSFDAFETIDTAVPLVVFLWVLSYGSGRIALDALARPAFARLARLAPSRLVTRARL